MMGKLYFVVVVLEVVLMVLLQKLMPDLKNHQQAPHKILLK